MAFNEILKLKKQKEDQQATQNKYIRNLIVGKDLFATKIFLELEKKVEAEQLMFISPENIESVRDLLWVGPSRTRGNNTELLAKLNQEASQSEVVKPIFFKEGKFHEFGSRAKSSPLLDGEEFFQSETIRVDENSFYPEIFEEGRCQDLLEKMVQCPIVSIEYEENPSDLVEPVFWKVELSDGRVFETTNLYWGLHPFQFIDLLKGKEKLNRQLIEIFQSMRTKAQISVEYNLKSDDFDEVNSTWFLPLSQTHDWGHFIGDFFKISDKENSESGADSTKVVARFLHFLDEKEVNEEDVAKKLRILRRNFEKILDKKKDILGSEYVRFEEFSDCQNINEEEFKNIEFPFKNVRMFGNNAPLAYLCSESSSCEDSEFSSTHFLRGYLSTNKILDTL